MYRKTKRSIEQLAQLRAARDRNHIASPAPDYAPMLPVLRRRIVNVLKVPQQSYHTRPASAFAGSPAACCDPVH